MAKIDVSTIEGYENMSAEDKLKALEELELPEPDYTGYVRKDVFDKTASELASKKKELSEKMSADEKKAAEEAEARRVLEENYNKLLRESSISRYKASYMALGYEEKLAEETAAFLVDGDIENVFKCQKKHKDAFERQVKADLLKLTPEPGSSGADDVVTLESLRKMSQADRFKFASEHPDEYKNLYGGK